MDLDAIFATAQRYADRVGLLRDRAGPSFGLWRQVVGLLPVSPVGDDWFEVMDARAARPADFRTIVAVRHGAPAAGYPQWMLDAVHGLPIHHAAEAAWWRMVAGEEIVDLLACDAAMRQPPRLLVGMAEALGDPFGEAAQQASAAEPLRVAETVADVVFGAAGRVLPLGNADRRAAYLRQASAVVVDSLDAGRRVKKLMEQPAASGPSLFVAQRKEAA